jgi:hypothetical protein
VASNVGKKGHAQNATQKNDELNAHFCSLFFLKEIIIK